MFYEKLKKLCFERGISVSKMAVELKISTTTVTGWKRGATPRPAQVKKMAEYFKISTDELMFDAPAAASPTELQDDNSTDLMGLVVSQQDSIRNLSESSKSFAKSTENFSESSKNISESNKNLSESTKDFAASTKSFAKSNQNLSESNKILTESNRSLVERLSKGVVSKGHR